MSKCKRKEILDCIFLTKNNVEEFKKAYEKHYKKWLDDIGHPILGYKIIKDEALKMMYKSNSYFVYEAIFFPYNQWYVFCENKCKEYNIDEFSKLYSVID